MASLKTLCLVLVLIGRVCSQEGAEQGGENAGDTVTIGGSTSDDGTNPVGGEVVTISGSNTDGLPSSTTQDRDEIEVNFEFTVINKRYIVEKTWLPKFCPVTGHKCNKAPLNNLAQNPFDSPSLNDCLLNCLKTMGCRGFNLVDQGSYVDCELLSDRCTNGGAADAGTTYYNRLKDTESDADCPPGSGPPVGPLSIWQNNYCFRSGHDCPLAELTDPSGYYTGPIGKSSIVECSRYCSWNPTCAGAVWDFQQPRHCTLLEERCDENDLTPDPDLTYIYRLKQGESCTGEQEILDTDTSQWTGRYCFSQDKYCPGGDVYINFQRLDEQECLGKCARVTGCQSVAYFYDDAADKPQCMPKYKRCDFNDLVDRTGYTEYYRLMIGEDCPITRIDGLPPTSFLASFCKASAMECPNFTFFNMPVVVADAAACLTLCVTTGGCQSVFFEHGQGVNECSLKSDRCDNADLEPFAGGDDYYRLQNGEECPPGRVADESSWSARFCYAPDRVCGGNDIQSSYDGTTMTFQHCLTLCVDTPLCRAAEFDDSGYCTLKSNVCDVNSLTEEQGNNYYARLNFGDNCDKYKVPKTPTCPPDSEYSDNASGCPKQCRDLDNSDCTVAPNPGCECVDGYAFDDDEVCIKTEDCDCYDKNGIARPVGDEWRSLDCETTYECVIIDNEPVIVETDTPCDESVSACEIIDNKPVCNCITGYEPDPAVTPDPDPDCVPVLVCPDDSTFDNEASACQAHCGHLVPPPCVDTQIDCVCDDPCDVWLDDSHNQCVSAASCGCYHLGETRALDSSWSGPDCKEYECIPSKTTCFAEVTEIRPGCVGDHEICDTNNECVCEPGYEYDDTYKECILECPENSTYNPAGSACPSTCSTGFDNESSCSETEETCECDDCYVKDGDTCVHVSTCEHCYEADGTQHHIDDAPWLSGDCGTQYECVEGNSGATTEPACQPHITNTPHTCPGDNKICVNGECQCPADRVEDANGDCILGCPENSSYNPAGSACQSTCATGFDNESSCGETEETCECDDCYVKDGDTCVHASTCEHCYEADGTQHHIDDAPWLSGDCGTQYECVEGNSGATTEPACQPHITNTPHTCPGDNKICVNGECQCPADRVEDANGDCILGCPENSSYNPAGSACQSTCATGFDNESSCGETEETCECDDCYVKDGDTCVHASTCEHCYEADGTQHHIDDAPWLSGDCGTQYECVEGNSGATTEPACQPHITNTPHTCPGDNKICVNGECQCPADRVEDANGDCILGCPENSTYNPAGSACQSTCATGFDNESSCSETEETCECDDCYVKDGDTCVHASTCEHCYEADGTQHHIDDDPWLSGDCGTQYECVEGNSGATTEPACQPHITNTPHTCPGDNKICVNGECQCPTDRVEDANGDCILGCPDYSVYNAQGSACPSTCATGRGNEATCSEEQETCECIECYAKNLQTGQCEPAADCDECPNNGDPKPVGTSWKSNDCTIEYTCNEGEMNTDSEKCWPHVTSGPYECPGHMAACNDGECGCPDGRVQQPNGDCILDCPQYSTYNPAGSACQSTCSTGFDNESSCSETEETCECDDCYVKDGDTCVHASTCEHCYESDGTAHHIADDPWLSGDCEIEHECVEGNSGATTEPACQPHITNTPHTCPGDNKICVNGECQCPADRVEDANGDCILGCPDYSVYNAQGSACPSTCATGLGNEATCSEEQETCECIECYAKNLQTGQCEPAADCDECPNNGDPKPVGTSWKSNDCTIEYTCNEGEMNTDSEKCWPHVTSGPYECPGHMAACNDGECGCPDGRVQQPNGDCILDCPQYSTYNPAGSACQSTCSTGFDNESSCSETEETCECDDCYVKDGDTCVHASTCEHCYESDGTAHHIADDPWLSGDCEIEHECVEGNSGATTEPACQPHITNTPHTCPGDNKICVNGECQCPADRVEDANGDCILGCPDYSVYNAQGSACPSTCATGLGNEATCSEEQETCECIECYAKNLQTGQCEPAADCDECPNNGDPKPVGTSWKSNDCTIEYTCNEGEMNTDSEKCWPHVTSGPYECPGHMAACNDGECGCPDGRVQLPNGDCILDCPQYSTYNPAGSACQSTCSTGFDNESSCSETEETCECDDCYVKDGDTCVHASTCEHCYESDGTAHHIADDPWLSGDCEIEHECVEGNSGATTEPACQPHITNTPHTCPGDNKICVNGECQCPADRVEDANGDCILGCPDYSVYNAQGSACPSTCATGLGNEATCSEEQETCECIECYAKNLQTGQCEPAADCDECPNNGDPRPTGTSWKSNDCTIEYTCNEGEMNTDSEKCWPHVTSGSYECPGHMAVCNDGECGCPDGRVQQPNGDCILDCPQYSTYNPAGSACQSTCSTGFDNESSCSETEETCECDDCYVKDGDTCVHASTCEHCYESDGTAHHIDDDPWLSGDCDTEHECVEGNSGATTEPACQPHITNTPHTCPGDNKICVNGECDCPLDRVEDANGDCILGCPDDSTYNSQGSACPSTCATGPGHEATCSEEEESCECDECYAKNLQTGECTPAADCNKCPNNGDPKLVGTSWKSNDCMTEFTCNQGEMNTDECWPYVTSGPYECPGLMAVCNDGECGCPDGRVQQPNGDCILDCPPGTVYNQHGSACESTCETGPGNEDTCTETAEICECLNNCYAKKLDDGTCIPAEECNLCTEGSMNYPVGEVFLSGDCTTEYECVAGDNSKDYPLCWPHLNQTPHTCPGAHQICSNGDSTEGGQCVCPDDRVMDDNDDCILPCPDNSEYSPDSASQCPITCDTVGADQSGCGTQEGCICNDCFVYNAETGQCDAGSSCDVCVDTDGNVHQLHDTFLSDDCTMEITCGAGDCYNVLSSTPNECPEFHECDNAGHCVCEEGYQPDPDDPEICVPIPTTAPPCPPGQPLGPIDIVVQTSTRVVIGSGGSCPHNSQHNPAASPCPATCHNPFNHVYCPHAPEPGCECHQHHLYDHMLGQCIHKDECGCHLNDVAHPVGSSWFNGECTILHMCKSGADGPVIDQFAYTCPEYSSCVSGEEGHHCACDAGYTKDADGNCTVV